MRMKDPASDCREGEIPKGFHHLVLYLFDVLCREGGFYERGCTFKGILDENGNVVIGFNEGDVAPMYMGAVEFEIPGDVLNDIRK